jgi:hypothetical protein
MSLLGICCLAVGAIGALTLGWGALKPLPEECVERREDRMEDLIALHAQYFPQLRQTLATLDEDYLRRKTSNEIERHLHAERKQVTEGFLSGLGEDFGRLERLTELVGNRSVRVETSMARLAVGLAEEPTQIIQRSAVEPH